MSSRASAETGSASISIAAIGMAPGKREAIMECFLEGIAKSIPGSLCLQCQTEKKCSPVGSKQRWPLFVAHELAGLLFKVNATAANTHQLQRSSWRRACRGGRRVQKEIGPRFFLGQFLDPRFFSPFDLWVRNRLSL
jgi:hypothetical protein